MHTVFHLAAFLALLQAAPHKQLLDYLATAPAIQPPCVLVTGVPEVDCPDPVPARVWAMVPDPDGPPPVDPRTMSVMVQAPSPHVVPETAHSYPSSSATPVVLDVEALRVLPAYILAALASGVPPEALFDYTRPRVFPKGIK